ncbi:hypothetical protein GSI_07414 [Ganoderma sinense ZZ0214-1]|uniref:MYND-type domain-containing protein n=1 Tax=Ganoderma sinense ZZ0214-1 TaxID=1077348 RepID=A0A2G8S8Y5_9APHY|nr:hypothetical protein GSI_07414 [Ganoderma sinense ZZ0214-1]
MSQSDSQIPNSNSNSDEFDPDQDPRAAFLNIEDYLAIKAACLSPYAYKDSFHYRPTDLELRECARYLSEWPGVRVLDQWKFGDPKARPQAVLETAIRYMSGCTIFRVCPEAALHTLDVFPQHHQPPPDAGSPHHAHDVRAPSPSLSPESQAALARAHACAAHAHFQKFRASDKDRTTFAADERHYRRKQTLDAGLGHPAHTSLRFALGAASESARLGHVSAIVLRVGFAAREIAEGLGVDFGLLVGRARRYRPLWRAVEECLEELYAEARKALGREAGREALESVCGAEGCGVRASSSASLKACSGRCPLDFKPRYCSKQCQVKDWSRHKEICKPGGVGKIPKIPNRLIALEWFELEDPAKPEPAPEGKSTLSAERGASPGDEPSHRVTDDEKPQEGDETHTHEARVDCAAWNVQDENAKHTHGGAVPGAENMTAEGQATEGNLPPRDSDHAPPVDPPTSPRQIVFGSISPEYLRTMWEEEGPEALTNTGVWASKVPATFIAPC